jgi:hypothetical protein
MKASIFFLIIGCVTAFTFTKNSLKGTWEVCDTWEDCESEGGVFLVFGDSTAQMLISFGGGLDPEPLGEEMKYIQAGDSLELTDNKDVDRYLISMMDKNRLLLIQNKDTVFLQKLK